MRSASYRCTAVPAHAVPGACGGLHLGAVDAEHERVSAEPLHRLLPLPGDMLITHPSRPERLIPAEEEERLQRMISSFVVGLKTNRASRLAEARGFLP